MKRTLVAVALALPLPVVPAQNVLRVGPGQTFQKIQAAHDAAVAGDRILVDPGFYPERLVLAKPVTVLAASDAWTGLIGPVRWRGIPAGQTGTIAGFDLESWTHTYGQAAGVLIEDCAGLVVVAHMRFQVRLEPISKYGYRLDAGPWVSATRSNVLISRCDIKGETIGLSHVAHAMGQPAFAAEASRMTITACQGYNYGPTKVPLRAGLAYTTYYSNPTAPPLPLVRSTNSVLVIENTSLGGGDDYTTGLIGPGVALQATGSSVVLGGVGHIFGGDARATGIAGGDAVLCDGSLAHDRVTLAGGSGTPPGRTVVGTTPVALHVPDLLGAPAVAARGAKLDWTARGRSGDVLVWLAYLNPQPFVVPGVFGVIGGPQPLVALLDYFPPGETTTQSLQLGTEAALIGQSLYVQVGTYWSSAIAFSALVPTVIR